MAPSTTVRRIFLASSLFGLVACGDGVVGPEDIVGTYTAQTVNGEEFGYTFLSFDPGTRTQTITEVTAERIVLGPQSSCEVNLTFTERVFQGGDFVGERTRTQTGRTGTFEFSNGTITLNYTGGSAETGSIVGSTLTITRGGDIWIFRK